ncbi:hypothetical protein FRB99_005977 [Tulasnella sp. 403]|nr:hypothetical protein FRB99_005977 [Tulasnella sp. 403]
MIAPILALFSAIAVASAASSSDACSRTYTVQDGDYCDAISAKNNASTYQLARSNIGVINDACSNLAIGQTICLALSSADCTTTYVVQPGDTCDGVTANYPGLNSTTFRVNNPQIDDNCWNLYIGEVVCVSPNPQVSPPVDGWTMPGAALDDGSGAPVTSDSSSEVTNSNAASGDSIDPSSDDTQTSDTTTDSGDAYSNNSDPTNDTADTTDNTTTSDASTTTSDTSTSTTSSAAASSSITVPDNAATDDSSQDSGDDEGDDEDCEEEA